MFFFPPDHLLISLASAIALVIFVAGVLAWRDRAPRRTSWVWCPRCRRDLNGDDASFQRDDNGVVEYVCATCGHRSKWLFDAPVPVLLDGPTRQREGRL